VVEQLEGQLVDMDNAPIKYLNAQIDTLGDLMTGTLNPAVHAIKYKELVDRRNALVEQQTKLMEAEGRTSNLYQTHLYNSKGDIVFTDWLRKGESPMQSKKIQAFIAARKAQQLDTYYDVPQSVKRANQAIGALLSNPALKATITQKFFNEGFDAASEAFRGIFDAAESAAGGQTAIYDEYNQVQNNFRGMGINMFDGSVNADNILGHKQRVVDYLNKNMPNASVAEKKQKGEMYYKLLNLAAQINSERE